MPWTSLLVGPSQPKDFKTLYQIGDVDLEVLHSNKKSLENRAQFSDIFALDDRSDDVACQCKSPDQDLENKKVTLSENSNDRDDFFENFVVEILEIFLTNVLKPKLKLDSNGGELQSSSVSWVNSDIDSRISVVIEKFLNADRNNQEDFFSIDVIGNKSGAHIQLVGKFDLGSLLVGLEVDRTEVEEAMHFSSGLLKYSVDVNADIIHLNLEWHIAREVLEFSQDSNLALQPEKVNNLESNLNFYHKSYGDLNGISSDKLKAEKIKYLFDQLSIILGSNQFNANEDGEKNEQLPGRLINIASGLKDSSNLIFGKSSIFNSTRPSQDKGKLISVSAVVASDDRYYIEKHLKEDTLVSVDYEQRNNGDIRRNIFNGSKNQVSSIVEIQKGNIKNYPSDIQGDVLDQSFTVKISDKSNEDIQSISSLEASLKAESPKIYPSDPHFLSLNNELLRGEIEVYNPKEIDRIRTENLFGLRRDVVYWISAQFRGLVENSDEINFLDRGNREIIVKNHDLGSIRVLLTADPNLLKIHFICTEYGTDIVLRSNIDSLIDEMHRSGYRDVRTSFSSEDDASGLQNNKEKNRHSQEHKRQIIELDDSKESDNDSLHLLSIYDVLDLRL